MGIYQKTQLERIGQSDCAYFQVSFFDGARNKEQFMNLVKSIDISDYTLSDFVSYRRPRRSCSDL